MIKYRKLERTDLRIMVLIFTGALIEFLYGFINLSVRHSSTMSNFNFSAAVMLFVNVLILLIWGNRKRSYLFALGICIIHFFYILLFGNGNEFSPFWILIIPHMIFYTLGHRKGIFLSVLILFALAGIAWLQWLSIFTTGKPPHIYRDLGLPFLIISLMTYIYEKSLDDKREVIRRQLFIDKLTDLPNRKQMFRVLNDKSREISIILINIDNFREINDIYGCTKGDMVLKELASRLIKLKGSVSGSSLYKLHADEFALILPRNQKNVKKHLINTAEQIHQMSLYEFTIGEAAIFISLSIGISSGTDNEIAHADSALRHARKLNRSYVIHSETLDMTKEYRNNLTLTSRLRSIINEDGIIPYFQPIASNANGSIEKYECLMRFKDGDEILDPGLFLELSKRTKMYGALTRTMVSSCFNFFKNRQEDFSINLCLDDILNDVTRDHIFNELDKHKVGDRLIIEFLETSRIEGHRDVENFIKEIRGYGCRIAIDDFGAGYSNFEYLLRMKFDYLKIDASIIRNLDTDENARIMVETIVSFSRKLGLKTIAEYVHSREIHKQVSAMGIEYSQGFFLGKPSPGLAPKGDMIFS